MNAAGEGTPGRRTGTVSQMGLLLRTGIAMAIFVFAGHGLDRVPGTLPWFLMAGVLVGVVAMLFYMTRTAGAKWRRRR